MGTTAPKNTWGGQGFPQGSLFVAIFCYGRTGNRSDPPRFLAAKIPHNIQSMYFQSYRRTALLVKSPELKNL